MAHHASGTFEVKMTPDTSSSVPGTARFSIAKTFHGGIEGTSAGEMISAGDPKTGNAGYVAIEMVTGKLDGKSGSFALQHTATMSPDGRDMDIVVTPGSGTGDLAGLRGTFKINIADGKHSYDFDYTLPQN